MAKVLIVEDDPVLRQVVCDLMTFEHHQVETADNGPDALHFLRCFGYDVVILDWSLPGLAGIEVLRQYRESGGNIPILMLTANKMARQKEEGLDTGADDYLTKPFEDVELTARVRALLRRASGRPQSILKLGNLQVDHRAYRALRNGEDLHLTPKEFFVLEFLMRNPGQCFSPEQILRSVWKSDDEVTTDSVRSCVKRLREKIDEPGKPSVITTISRGGYKLEVPAD
jgi:DNA-binding response OmpR family regulator